MGFSTIQYAVCPVCGSKDIQAKLSAKDHTVSGSVFEIWECGSCSLRFTQDAPDQQSIHGFYKAENYISHTNTSKGLINRLYLLVRGRTLALKRRLICTQTGVAQGRLLDIGAGTGAFVREMQVHGWEVTGLEPDEEARARALALHDVHLKPLAELDHLEPNRYEAISMWHVLEHVHDLHACVEQLKVLLKPGGVIFIAVPNYTSHDGVYYGADWAAYDVPRHLYHFSPQSMKQLLEIHQLKLRSEKPMWFDAFYISMISEQYSRGGQHFFRGMLSGFLSNINAVTDKEKCSSVIYVAGK